jgi:hypothetical protein
MFYIASTRFNNKTYNENIEYRRKNNEIVIYGASTKIRNKYPIGSLIFVAEMNNETNKVEGIGLIHNNLVNDKYYKIYTDSDYNRCIYRGKYWISRNNILDLNTEIITILDNILFKGKSNLKRFSGITILTEKLFMNWDYELYKLKQYIQICFINYFKEEPNKIIKEEEINEDVEIIIICKKNKKNKYLITKK